MYCKDNTSYCLIEVVTKAGLTVYLDELRIKLVTEASKSEEPYKSRLTIV